MAFAPTSPEFTRAPRDTEASRQGLAPSHYSFGVRTLSMLAFSYVAFAFLNGKFFHLFEDANGDLPILLSQSTEYFVIMVFGIWRTNAERDPYTRKRLGYLTLSVGILWWFLPDFLRLPEPHIGALPGQPIFPQIHAPGTLTFFGVLLLVLLFGRRIVCGWNCPCVAIRETVGFSFRESTLRSNKAWNRRHTKWFFFSLYMIAFVLIMFSGTAYVSPFYGGFLSLVGITYFGSFFIAPITGNRFYCRYLCPYGATFGLLNHIGFYGIRMNTSACVDCQKCSQVCDMGIPVWEQGKEHGKVTGIEDCMGCGRCVVSCPTDALEFRDVRNEFIPNLRMDASHLLKRSGPPEISKRIEADMRPTAERSKDWSEEKETLTLEAATLQAQRCLDCGVPGCQNACPLNNRIPEWLESLAEGDVEGAANISNSTSNMPDICGTICPTHKLCEGGCTLNAKDGPVTIGALERFVTEEATRNGWEPMAGKQSPNGKTAAVVGAGPAGLACADELSKSGFEVTVYEKRNEIGGLLTYGVPTFKLDKQKIVDRRANYENSGIKFELGVNVDTKRLASLINGNDAVFLGTGAQKARVPNLNGKDLDGIKEGVSFLSELNETLLTNNTLKNELYGENVVVLGGGDTALDCARSAIRQGANKVTIAYRNGPEQIRISQKEISIAKEEGVKFEYFETPKTFAGNNKLESVVFGNEKHSHSMQCDVAIVAFGQEAEDFTWITKLGVKTNENGFIIADSEGRSTNPKVFVGGDNTHGPDLAVTAIAAGRRAGQSIARTI